MKEIVIRQALGSHQISTRVESQKHCMSETAIYVYIIVLEQASYTKVRYNEIIEKIHSYSLM